MEHTGNARPQLPGTTLAPGPSGRKSVYSTRLPATTVNSSSGGGARGMNENQYGSSSPSPTSRPSPEGMILRSKTYNGTRLDGPPVGLITAQMAAAGKAGTLRLIQEKTISKLTAKLPNQLRSTVAAVVEMAFASTDDVQRQLDMSRFEVCALREQLSKRNHEVAVLNKSSDILREKLTQAEDNINVLKDNIETNQKHDVKNKAAMQRLASTNRMLFDSLEALQADTEAAKKLAKGGQPEQRTGGVLLTSSAGKNLSPSKKFAPENEQSVFQSDKLRESLLRVTREHYKFMKYAENLDRKVTELRGALRSQEQLNRKLKAEVDEYRALLRTDDMEEMAYVGGEVGSMRAKQKQHTVIDARLQDMIERNAFDPIDGIQLMRRILARMATSPNDLSLKNMIKHIVAQESLRIFSCDMICLYIKPPSSDGSCLLRYTVKSPQPVEVKLTGATSLAAEAMKSGKVTRLNVLDGTCFSIDIDCVAGVLAKRVMALPLYNTETKEVFGCIHMINKQHNDLYSDVDELFGMIFADQSSLLLTSCMMFDSVSYHAELLQALLESSTALFSVIPDPNSLAGSRSLSAGVILTALEAVAKDLLKCADARAFLVSDYVGLGAGRLVMLERANLSSVSREVQLNSLLTPPIHSGIAGYVVQSRAVHEMSNSGYDTYVNPTVDLDPLMSSMVALPIMDLYGTVVGCIELVIGPRSPGVRQTSTNGSSVSISSAEGLTFIQSAQWFIHQITTPLQYLLNFIGRPVTRPISTPSRINRTPGKATSNRPFFGYALDGVNEDAAASSLPLVTHHKIAVSVSSKDSSIGAAPAAEGRLPPLLVSDSDLGGKGDFMSLPLEALPAAAPLDAEADATAAAAAAAAVRPREVQWESEISPKRAARETLPQLEELHEQQQGQIESLQQRFQEGVNEIASLQGEVDAYKSLLDSVREELEEARAQSAEATAAAAAASVVGAETPNEEEDAAAAAATAAAEKAAADAALEEARAQIEQLREQLEQQEAAGEARAADDDAVAALDRALAQQAENDKTVEQLRAEVAAVNEARIRTLEELTASQQATERATEELAAAKKALEDAAAAEVKRDQLQLEVDRLTSRCAESDAAVAAKDAALQQAQRDLSEATAKWETLQREKAELEQQLQSQQPAAAASGDDSAAVPAVAAELAIAKERNSELEQRVQALEATVAQKEAIQKALQEQVVKMAGQGMLSPTASAASDAEALLFGGISSPTRAKGSGPSGPPPPAAAIATATTAPSLSLAEELLFSASSKKNVFSPTAASTAEELLFGMSSPAPHKAVAPVSDGAGGAVSTAEELLFGTSRPLAAADDHRAAKASSSAAAVAAAAADWEEQVDDYGNVYYYNAATGESSWTNPQSDSAGGGGDAGDVGDGAQYNSDGLLQKGDWVQNFDDSGTPYWINQVTGESSWSIP